MSLSKDETQHFDHVAAAVMEFEDDPRAHVSQIIEAGHGLEYLGMGEGRVVFALDAGRVLKIAMDMSTMGDEGQNSVEIHRWRTAGEKELERLAPLLGWAKGEEWLVMRRTQPPGRLPLDVRFAMAALAGDAKQANIGLLDGHLVLHDYGIPRQGMSASKLFALKPRPGR